MLSDPTGLHDIGTLAHEVGTSARTLSRLFSAETQLSFKSWCQRARIAAAIERLSMEADVSVKQLAADLGYASVPAFSHAFRQVTGKTPTEFAERKRVTRASYRASISLRKAALEYSERTTEVGPRSSRGVPARQGMTRGLTLCTRLIVIGTALNPV